MMPFEVTEDETLESIKLIEFGYFQDERGWFSEFFKSSEFENSGLPVTFRQVNRSQSKSPGTIRGLHLQLSPMEQGKLVCCTKGAIFDVAVDVSKDSPTFGMWTSYVLDDTNQRALWIPGRFAHGFQTLTEDCEMLYFHTNEYVPEAEGALNANDPALDINWPLDIQEISDRDQNHPIVAEGFEGVQL